MRKFITTLKNIWSIEELRDRILSTFGFLVIYRLGSYVVFPGIDPSKLSAKTGGLFDLLDTFLGGAFSKASIFGLGIMPYISASIVIQLVDGGNALFSENAEGGRIGHKKNKSDYQGSYNCYMFNPISGLYQRNHS